MLPGLSVRGLSSYDLRVGLRSGACYVRRMRIAFLAITLGVEAKGGEMYIHQLANALTERGNEVLVLQSGPALPGALYKATRIPVPFRLHRMYTGPLRPSLSSLQERIIQKANQAAHHAFLQAAMPCLTRFRPQILLPLLMEPELLYAKILRRLLGCRLVSIGHGGAGNDALALGAVDAFVAASPRQANWAKYFEQARVELIPVGVDTKQFTPDGPVASLSLERPVLMQVGSLIPVKRPQLSLSLLKRLQRGSLLLIGDGKLANEIDQDASASLGASRYLRIASMPHYDLPLYYRAADALLFPSDTGETAGLVTLEALSCGTPVVATNDETRHWMLGSHAELTDPTDVNAYEAAALRAIERKGDLVLRAYALTFDWSVAAAKHEALYRALLGG
jgi:glycosyltransferase involved in cell wall biosynthesis